MTKLNLTNMTVADLRKAHDAAMKLDNDLTRAEPTAIRKEIIRKMNVGKSSAMNFDHCQSCGNAVNRHASNEGYSPCCNELIVAHCHHDVCFHVI